jgi:hypothetical protein
VIVFGVGLWLGRRLIRPAAGEITVGWREMWRRGPDPDKYKRNPKARVVSLCAFGGVLIAFGLRLLSEYAQSLVLATFSVYAGLLCIAIAWGAMLFSKYSRKPLK